MSGDIFAHWKTSKFIINDEAYDLDFPYCIVLTDTQFWYNAYDELIEWVGTVGGQVSGMIVNLPDEHAVTTFCLKWR